MIKHQTILSILLATALTGCGLQEGFRERCTISQTACDTVFGKNTVQAVEELDARVVMTEKEIETIKTVLDDQIKTAQLLSSQVQTNEMLLLLLQSSQSNQGDTIQTLVDSNQTLVERIDYQQTLINSHQIEINNLASEDSVVEYYDPCGQKPGAFNEVLLKTRTGKYLCYFESGGNRFLHKLEPGSYRTTDGTKCYFTLNVNGTVTNEHY